MDGEATYLRFTFDDLDIILEALNDARAELQDEWRREDREAIGEGLDKLIARFGQAWDDLHRSRRDGE